MPLYEYKCKSCEKTFEVLQKMNEEPMTECLYCCGSVEKLVSSTSFQLKGSGWYVTDYKNNGSQASSNQEKKTSLNQDSKPDLGSNNATIK